MGEGTLKPVVWMGSSRRDIQALPNAVQDVFGFAIYEAQRGSRHVAAKVLKGFGGAGVLEVVEDDQSGTYRAVYTVKFAGAVYVLHVFQKKSKKGIETPRHELELIRRRLREAAAHYEEHRHEYPQEGR